MTRLVRGDSARVGIRPATATVSWAPDRGQIDVAGTRARRALRRRRPPGRGRHRRPALVAPTASRSILDSRTDSTRLLVDTLLRLVGARLRCWSAPRPSAIYGDRGDEELTEASTSGTGFLADVCRAWEAAAQPAADAGIRTVLPPHRHRPQPSRRGAGASSSRCSGWVSAGGWAPGDQYRSWITLDDEIGAILHCLADDGLAGPVNATAPAPATDAELARALGTVLHRPTRPGRAGLRPCDWSSGPRWPTSWSSVASGSSRACCPSGDTPSPTPSWTRRSVRC